MATPRHDYRASFTITRAPADARTPEQWARAVFEDAPVLLRPLLVAGWLGLGLRGDPRRSVRRVLGWAIIERSAHAVVLEQRSPLLVAANAVLIDGAQVQWTTTVRYRRRVGGLLWRAAVPIHHRMVPYLLDRACRAVPAG